MGDRAACDVRGGAAPRPMGDRAACDVTFAATNGSEGGSACVLALFDRFSAGVRVGARWSRDPAFGNVGGKACGDRRDQWAWGRRAASNGSEGGPHRGQWACQGAARVVRAFGNVCEKASVRCLCACAKGAAHARAGQADHRPASGESCAQSDGRRGPVMTPVRAPVALGVRALPSGSPRRCATAVRCLRMCVRERGVAAADRCPAWGRA